MHDIFSSALQQYLAGELPFDAAAHAMSRSPEFHLVQVTPIAALAPDAQARWARLPELMTRVQEINEAERLIERAATAPRIDAWSAPPNPTDFCFSLEVILSGRDARRSYTASYRLYVCTPAWIARQVHEAGPRWITAPLVLPQWKPQYVQQALEALVHQAGDEKWEHFVARMARTLEPEG